MSAFEFFSVAYSFVLGLGISRLLLSAVYVFRSRRTLKLHWIPLTWAFIIFVWQIQFWWAIFELESTISVWTHLRFLSLFLLTLCLFVAGVLILPSAPREYDDDLVGYFDRDGRWALAFLSAYSALAMWANWYFFATSPISGIGAIVTAMFCLPIVFLASENRSVQSTITAAYLLLTGWSYVVLSPAAYQ